MNTKQLTCGECEVTKDAAQFYEPMSIEPHCKACIDGEWEMRGADPCGKDWM